MFKVNFWYTDILQITAFNSLDTLVHILPHIVKLLIFKFEPDLSELVFQPQIIFLQKFELTVCNPFNLLNSQFEHFLA